jgi:hypothetical protein
MSHLKLHDAPADENIPETYRFPAAPSRPARAKVHPSVQDSDVVQSVERNLDHVQARLNNLRDLMDRFGLGLGADGPRAA